MYFIIKKWEFGLVVAVYTFRGLRAIILGSDIKTVMKRVHTQFPLANKSITPAPLKTVLQHMKSPLYPYKGKLDINGTHFQKKVWNAILKIPYGSTLTYTELACSINHPKACRAVAHACGSNPLALVIPCHRVVGKKDIGGYHWGVDLKRMLLKKEQLP